MERQWPDFTTLMGSDRKVLLKKISGVYKKQYGQKKVPLSFKFRGYIQFRVFSGEIALK